MVARIALMLIFLSLLCGLAEMTNNFNEDTGRHVVNADCKKDHKGCLLINN